MDKAGIPSGSKEVTVIHGPADRPLTLAELGNAFVAFVEKETG